LSQGKESPRGYAAVELATAASEITVFAIMSSDPRRSAQSGIFGLGITWAVALGFHGLVNLVRHHPASEPATAPVARTAWLDVAPTMVDAGRDRVAPGLALAGRF
jgi:hypothetical protein